jgi:hypothetical protein
MHDEVPGVLALHVLHVRVQVLVRLLDLVDKVATVWEASALAQRTHPAVRA